MTKIKNTHWTKWLGEDDAVDFASCAQQAGMSIGDFVKRELTECYGYSPADEGFYEIAKHCAAQISQEATPHINKVKALNMTLREYYVECIANGVNPLTGEAVQDD